MIKTISNHSCKAELNDVELRATPARIAVMQFLEKTNSPVDVNAVNDYLNNEHINTDPATVFRTMHLFTQKGLTKQISFHEGKFRYELAKQKEHHHLICETCGKVEDFAECAIPQLETDIQKMKQFTVTRHALEFYGVCKDCQK